MLSNTAGRLSNTAVYDALTARVNLRDYAKILQPIENLRFLVMLWDQLEYLSISQTIYYF